MLSSSPRPSLQEEPDLPRSFVTEDEFEDYFFEVNATGGLLSRASPEVSSISYGSLESRWEPMIFDSAKDGSLHSIPLQDVVYVPTPNLHPVSCRHGNLRRTSVWSILWRVFTFGCGERE